MRMLTDNPISSTEQDRFGFRAYASLLVSSIVKTPDLPFCLGIFGSWGTGKTSLMKMIKEKLENSEGVKTIWFNPWKYDKQEAIWSALIQAILYDIAASADETAAEKATQLARSTAWILFKKGISAATGGVLSGESLEDLRKIIVQQDELFYRHINSFEQDFEEVVQMFTDGGRLVILVDDLDRCLPENAVTVLESLKLFIGDAKCVFVLGMDPFVVERGITSRYGENFQMSGRDYLDKIVQIPFFLPQIPFQKLRKAVEVAKTADYDDKTWKLLEVGLGGNPRKTIRFVNSYYLLRQIVKHPDTRPDVFDEEQLRGLGVELSLESQNYYLAKLMVFQLGFDRFYSYLEQHPIAWSQYEDAFSGDMELKQLFQIHPGLEAFWHDERLRSFMNQTMRSNDPAFPKPPGLEVVRLLMKATNIVAGSKISIPSPSPSPSPSSNSSSESSIE